MSVAFRLDREVMRVFPETQVRFVAARGVRNNEPWPEVQQRLAGLEKSVAAGEWSPFGDGDARIASWHDAYRLFGSNPRRFRPSVDALSRRLSKNHALPRISPAVDAYNLVSVCFGTPAGAFDISTLSGVVMIRFAKRDDVFTPLGEPSVTEAPQVGEVVYAIDSKVLTRHWNHRDCESTKVTPESRDIVFILERISTSAVTDDQMSKAQEMLAGLVRPHADTVDCSVIEPETSFTELKSGEPGLMV